VKPSHDHDSDDIDYEALDNGKFSLFRLIFPPNTFTVVFAHILLLGASCSWLAGVFFFQPDGISVEHFKVLFIGSCVQVALLGFFFMKMLRFSKRFRYFPAYAAAICGLLHAVLAVKALVTNEAGVLWYTCWALVSLLSWWIFNSSRVDQLLESNAIRYKLLHGRDPYEELADLKARKAMKKQKKGP
jgi:hypothetical protein